MTPCPALEALKTVGGPLPGMSRGARLLVTALVMGILGGAIVQLAIHLQGASALSSKWLPAIGLILILAAVVMGITVAAKNGSPAQLLVTAVVMGILGVLGMFVVAVLDEVGDFWLPLLQVLVILVAIVLAIVGVVKLWRKPASPAQGTAP